MRRRIKVNGRLYEAAGSVEDAVRKVVKTYKGESLINLWNDICSENNLFCDVYEIDGYGEFNDIFSSADRKDLYKDLERGGFNPRDKYFCINDWDGAIQTSNNYMDFIDVDYIVDAIVDDDNDFGYEDIAQALGH